MAGRRTGQAPRSGTEYPPCARLAAGHLGADLWYPDSGRELPDVVRLACATCWRRAACLTEALTRPEEHGIWAGLAPAMRLGLRQRLLLSRNPDRVIRDGLALADEDHRTRNQRNPPIPGG